MQTGVLPRIGTSEAVLSQWENGELGPMVSSHRLSNEEKKQWGLLG